MARPLRSAVLLVLALLLASPAAGKRKPPPPPPPPPDTAADCAFVVVPAIDDYLVLATLSAGVQCETTKQSITVTATFTRDGVDVPLIPYDTRTCTNTTACAIPIDLFSYDNHPVAFPGDQVYCARGTGVVGGTTVGPGSGCEADPRL